MKKPIVRAILDGAAQIATPTLVSTLSICIVFVPVLLLTGAAKYLFTPLAMAVVFAMLTSYFLTRTVVPTLMHYLMKPEMARIQMGEHAPVLPTDGWVWRIHKAFDGRFERLRQKYRELLSWTLHHRPVCAGAFAAFVVASLFLIFFVGRDFFPNVDAGQIRLHLRAPTGTRIEETAVLFANVEKEIRTIIPSSQLETILDNIGLPASGINLASSDTATIGDGDGDILVALKAGHHEPTAVYVRQIREMLHRQFPNTVSFFQPADITTQILNFGLPAPIDVQVAGRSTAKNYEIAREMRDEIARIPGTVDVTLFQVPDYPEIDVNVDRLKAHLAGLTQRDVAGDMLVSLSASGSLAPNQWVDPANGVSYSILVQTPQYRIDSLSALEQTPITSSTGTLSGQTYSPFSSSPTRQAPPAYALGYGNPDAVRNPAQFLDNISSLKRNQSAEIVDHYDIAPVFDVYVSVDRRDLGSTADAVGKIVRKYQPRLPGGSAIHMRGQVQTMNDSFLRLGAGILAAMMFVYLLMAVNFQSWVDPFVVLTTIPAALAGVLWMLFVTRTTLSVPALMGAILTIGVASANAILIVTFANDEQTEGKSPLDAALSAGYVRIRPVIMTAIAMILGMLPMSLALGSGSEQNAPLGRAVIGGLLFVTVSNLLFVPIMYSYLRKTPPIDFPKRIEAEAQGAEL
jgi:multidrug efflux pump subunit AcrB